MGDEARTIEERKQRLREKYGIRSMPEDVDLFSPQPGRPKHRYAVVKGHNTWDAIAEGYKLAAKELADFVLLSGYHQDYLIYPICFMYRCYLEVRMKELLVAAQLPVRIASYRHDLLKLWRDTRYLVFKYSGSPGKDVDRIEIYVKQFHHIDPKADGFRYPLSAEGFENLTRLTQVDMGTLRNVMEAIADNLDGASIGIYEASLRDRA